MLAIDEVYWTVNEDRTRLTVSTEPPVEQVRERLELLLPEPKSYRLHFALGSLALANLADLWTTAIGISKGANEFNPVANALFGWMGILTGLIVLKVLLLIIASLGARRLWRAGRQARLTAMSLIWFAVGLYLMVAVNNYNMITVLNALSQN
jgi:hypothetical protein